jgi:C4-type Zn-finger protein
MLSKTTVSVGYVCPVCKKCVVILRSVDPLPFRFPVASQCQCGYSRRIDIIDIQSLDVWREVGAAA